MRRRVRHASWLFLCLVALSPLSAYSRTIILDANDCDLMGAISAASARFSWAMYPSVAGGDVFYCTANVVLSPETSLLLRFPLSAIPAGHRIAHAELLMPVHTWAGNDPRFFLWRLLADWGAGVSYLYRRTKPETVEWEKPGARGQSSDRATQPTDVIRIVKLGEVSVNVTEDVEVWYTGAAPNNGWLVTVEDPGVQVTILSPIWNAPAEWKLRITYEPGETQ